MKTYYKYKKAKWVTTKKAQKRICHAGTDAKKAAGAIPT